MFTPRELGGPLRHEGDKENGQQMVMFYRGKIGGIKSAAPGKNLPGAALRWS